MRIADQLAVDCPVFYVDNVSDYIDGLSLDERGRMAMERDEENLIAPPFKEFFIEWRSRTVRFDDARQRVDGIVRHAVHFEVLHDTATDTAVVDPDLHAILSDPDGSPRWIVKAQSYMQRLWDLDEDGLPWLMEHRAIALSIDGDGALISSYQEQKGDAPAEGKYWGWRIINHPALLAICFMHCKNVRHVEHKPKLASGKGWKQTTSPKLTYYTLEIDPMKETLRREGNVETVGLAKALHICRGHFKDYRASGLFGKIKGIFWWGPALRGTPEAGTVVKDYAVEAPSHTSAQVI